MADAEEYPLRPAGSSAAPISFSFSRTTARRRLADPVDDAGAAPEEKDFLKTVEGRELQSVKPSENPKDLIIPLIQNGHRRQPPAQAPGPSTNTEALMDGVLSQAVKELIEDSKKSLEERENSGVDPTLAIPMIQKGCIPNGEGADSEPRAETVPEEADYEAVPVEAYGLAMLRGMGWKPGEGIGRTFNLVVKPRLNLLRPKGLGLGANLNEVQALVPTGPHHLPKPDEEQEKAKEDQPQGLVPGGAVVVLSGPHRGLYGKVEGLDPDNVRAMVRLAVGNRMVTVSEYCLRPVSQHEFDKNTLDLSQMNKTSPGQQNGTASSWKALRDQDLPSWREDSERKRKHLPDRQGEPAAKNEKAGPQSQHWLHRDLRVRFVDRQHKGGQYYNTKMTIEDVLSPDTCVCRTDEGRILEGLKENMLETLVPKVEGNRVMVVLGPQAGRVGRLLGRNRERSRALVQLRRENQLVELHYDAVCQYMGPSDSDED
ncbi:G-patch domain and KOW motifs-containing protein [Canis lupus baileyi]|uniref:G-patch domain and KOW motifs-containing protein n=2 Tax=Canis lupus TaxID=9612 RepID=A0A8C0SC86_CANLF|nr:G-patch domain and KOW motifs-containing protein [Canis lupus familiaris]XP_013967240.1 G-patch domain and KOW motifs-containing protein [Canis lupus familiaris]XP_025324453.1 G-patch domain and KOW motifs-containing protein [Canis lupus dingo]XP_025324454.1 G-patch domain and KOW motifs-containing protein [Canis lupus dingo]XP_038443349.1 G-patch domain and KOW motifs-containing protein-like [Canis lupus familiaris]XP_038443350.1 G-patch domain and KOW motifs-containing protein-like [Canis|eukprot:XP_005641406.1 G patch domain and KOW motifs-containing protein [Canis lupus familiaris]